MAADAGGVRIVEQLRIKIGEAKNLPPRVHGAIHRDVYCCLSLDQEEIFRTSVAEKTLDPYFGEEFQFEVPREFRFLSIYVFDRDRQYKQDRVLGKVAIHREELKNYNMDHWFALRPVDADSEVQGQAHLEIFFKSELESMRPLNIPAETDAIRAYEQTFANDSVLDRKNSKTKNSFKASSHQRDDNRFGSYSSTSGKKIMSNVPENVPMSLGRSESLRSGQSPSAQQTMYNNTYGPSSSKSTKNFIDDVQLRNTSYYRHSPRSESDLNKIGSSKSSIYPPKDNFYDVSGSSDLKNKLSVKVLECSELTLKNGQCDPFAIIAVNYKNGKTITKKTRSKKRTVNPKFDEMFVFDLTMDSNPNKEKEGNTYTVWPAPGADDVITEICVSLWHYNFFLGEVRLPIEAHQQSTYYTNAWYVLGSRQNHQGCSYNTCNNGYELIRGSTPSGTQYSNTNPTSLGSLRLLLNHTLDRVLPLNTYEKLQCLLLQQNPNKSITSSAVYILGQIINVGEIAQPLVRVFTHADLLVPTIKALADTELSTLTDPTTIFRGNTLVSKMMDEAMKLTGHAYLKATLLPTLDTIFLEKKCCEIDPTKVKDQSTIETNLGHLKEYVEKIFVAITQSFINCPNIMCRLFDALRQCATQKFPRDSGVRYSVVSSFIFLRFFAPAILGPRLFDIKSEQIDIQTARTLTLISKTITTLGNHVSSRSSQHAYKEEYMGILYKSFCTETYVQAIKKFLEIISTNRDNQSTNPQETKVVLKEGVMSKRIKRSKTMQYIFTNLKKRYFLLTNRELSYSKSRGKKPSMSIALGDIVAVEPVAEVDNLKMNNAFQIVCKDKKLYIQASNCVERKEWLDILGKLCEGRNLPQKYHPSTYMCVQWNCCNATSENAIGCVTVAVEQPISIRLGLDPARDLQRIHSLLLKNIHNIEKIVQPRSAMNMLPSTVTDDPSTYIKTVKELIKETYSLEDEQRKYLRDLERKTKYGSKQAPIGDDNYLHLASRNADSNLMKHSQSVIGSDVTFYDGNKACSSMKLMPQHSKSMSGLMKPGAKQLLPLKLPQKMFYINLSDTPMFDFKTTPSNYLNNSLYITSSTESDIVPNSSEGNNEDDSNSGYLKMLGVRNCDTNSLNMMKSSKFAMTVDNMRNDKGIPSSTSEYVTSNIDKDKNQRCSPVRKSPPLIKEKPSGEEVVNSSQYSCQEYEMISNCTSYSKSPNKTSDSSPDTPPAIPPRNHHTISPSYLKYKKPGTKTSVREHKSLDQYQLKTEKSLDEPKVESLPSPTDEDKQDFYVNNVNNIRLNNTQESTDTSTPISNASLERRSQIIELCECPVAETDSKNSKCVTNIEINDRPVLSDNFQNRLSDTAKGSGPSLVSSKDSENVDVGQDVAYRHSGKETGESLDDEGFSRKSVQCKSVPNKSRFSKKADGDVPAMDSPRSQIPLSNRLTSSLLKRKTKVNT